MAHKKGAGSTKMEVNYPHAQLKSPYISIHDANNMVPAIGERSSEECITLPTITNAVPSTSSTLSSHHEINSGLPRLNVQFICSEKGIPNYNEIPKVNFNYLCSILLTFFLLVYTSIKQWIH